MDSTTLKAWNRYTKPTTGSGIGPLESHDQLFYSGITSLNFTTELTGICLTTASYLNT